MSETRCRARRSRSRRRTDRSRRARRPPRQPAARSSPAHAGADAAARREGQPTRAPQRRLDLGIAVIRTTRPRGRVRIEMHDRCATRNSGAAGIDAAAPEDEPEPTTGRRGRVGKVRNAMRSACTSRTAALPPWPRPAAPGSAQPPTNPAPPPPPDLDEDRWRPVAAHARHAGDGQARAATAARDEDRQSDEHDKGQQPAPSLHRIRCTHGQGQPRSHAKPAFMPR